MKKKCTHCGEVKPPIDFHKDDSNKDGRRGECKICKRKMTKKRWNTEIGFLHLKYTGIKERERENIRI